MDKLTAAIVHWLFLLVAGTLCEVSAFAAPLYVAVDLGSSASADGVFGGKQVGSAGSWPVSHAILWRGTAASAVDLNPTGYSYSIGTGISGSQQVGLARGPITDFANHALLWNGSAASAVDLNPSDYRFSYASGVDGGYQVGGGLALAAGNNGNLQHALRWSGSAGSVIDLHQFLPGGFTYSEARGISNGQIVGMGYGSATPSGFVNTRALLWNGTAGAVNLHPSGFTNSSAYGVGDGQQVGDGSSVDFSQHALLWSGTAASVVDLNPVGFSISSALGASKGKQVGFGYKDDVEHALLWSGTAASVVDLHQFLPAQFTGSSAYGIDDAGNIVGAAFDSNGGHAILWKPLSATITTPKFGVHSTGNPSEPEALKALVAARDGDGNRISMGQAAQRLGFDHFNWVQYIVSDTFVAKCGNAGFLALHFFECTGMADMNLSLPTFPPGTPDPVLGGYVYQGAGPNHPAADYWQFYYDEYFSSTPPNRTTFPSPDAPEYLLGYVTDDNVLNAGLRGVDPQNAFGFQFVDEPKTSPDNLGPNSIEFVNALVGVSGADCPTLLHSGCIGTIIPGTTFHWSSKGNVVSFDLGARKALDDFSDVLVPSEDHNVGLISLDAFLQMAGLTPTRLTSLGLSIADFSAADVGGGSVSEPNTALVLSIGLLGLVVGRRGLPRRG